MTSPASTSAAAAAVLTCALFAAASAGCVHVPATGTAVPPPRLGATLMQPVGPTCPLASIPDVDATITQLDTGIAITFVAPPEQRERLRAAVRDMATPQSGSEPVDLFAGCSCPTGTPGSRTPPAASGAHGLLPGEHAEAAGAPTPARPMVFDTSARQDDIPTGAILLLRVSPSSAATALETVVREKMAAMREGCGGR
jgi:hypothetical protein